MFHTILMYSYPKSSIVHTKTVLFTANNEGSYHLCNGFIPETSLFTPKANHSQSMIKKITLNWFRPQTMATGCRTDAHTNGTHAHGERCDKRETLSRSLQKTLPLFRSVSSPAQTRHLCAFLLRSPPSPVPLHADP